MKTSHAPRVHIIAGATRQNHDRQTVCFPRRMMYLPLQSAPCGLSGHVADPQQMVLEPGLFQYLVEFFVSGTKRAAQSDG